MKVKTNVRAGKGGADTTTSASGGNQKQKHGVGSDESQINNTVISYVAPSGVSRCVGV